MVQGRVDGRRFDDHSRQPWGSGRPGFSDQSPPPPPPRENWLGWVAFLLGVAVISGAAGYGLNRATGTSRVAGAPAATSTSRPGAVAPGTAGPGQNAPGAGGPTAEQIAILLAEQGLPLRTTVVYTAQNDPDGLLGQPGGYASRLAFADSRISANEIAGAAPDAIERGGAIEVFGDPNTARSRGAHLQRPGSGPAAEYTYVQGVVVLRLSLILPERMAAGYQTALIRIARQPS